MQLIIFLITLLVYVKTQELVSIGANIDGIADWSRTNAFVDVVKQSRQLGIPSTPWIFNSSLPILADDGWPVSDFGIILMASQVEPINGTYKVSFEADALPDIKTVACKATISTPSYDNLTNIWSVDLTVASGESQLMLSFTNTVNGIRNLKIIRPGYDPVNPPVFTNDFIDHLSSLNLDTIRFMDWGRTNGNPITSWSERSTLNTVSFTSSKGVCLEYMISLTNQLNTNIWINIPHKADDDYVRNAALLIQSQLKPNLAVYVEYSNEVWNWQFSQANWNLDQAKLECNSSNSCNLNYDGVNNPGYWAWRRTARRLVEISNIFRSVFGDQQMMSRVRPILAGQIAWSEGIKTGVKFIEDVYGSVNYYIYGIAGAPYFNLNGADVVNNLTSDNVLDLFQASINSWKYASGLIDYAVIKAKYNLALLAYEGGPDTFGPNNIEAKKNATNDARMQDLCINYLNNWFGAGFDTFNWFVAGATTYNSQYGTWGLTDNMKIQDTPKIRALKSFINKPKPSLNLGELVPGFIDGRKYAGYNINTAVVPSIRKNGKLNYLIQSNLSTPYYLTISVSTSTFTILQIQVNNDAPFKINVSNTNNLVIAQQYNIVDFRRELNNLNVLVVDGSCKVSSIDASFMQPPPVISNPPNVSVVATLFMSYQITAFNYPIGFSAENLPQNLTIDPNTGIISGTPAVAGVYVVTIIAYNSAASGSALLTINVLKAALLSESFEYDNGQLQALYGGEGFSAPWFVQNRVNNSFKIASVSPLLYTSVYTTGNYLSGGGAWLSAGRQIDVTNKLGYFAEQNSNFIGADGKTLWFGALARKTNSNNNDFQISLHPDAVAWYINGVTRIGIGFFGSQSVLNNTRYWSLKAGNQAPILTKKSIAINQTAFLVMQINFGNGNNQDIVSFYVNPDPEQAEAIVPDAQISNITVQFRNIALYPGSNADEGAVDEIRLGVSFKAVCGN